MDGRGVAARFRVVAKGKPVKGDSWHDRINATDRDHAPYVARRKFVVLQVARIGCQKRHQVSTGRVPANEDLLGVAGIVGDVAVNPGKGSRDVSNVVRMFDVWRQAVIDDRGGDAMGGEMTANSGIQLTIL